MIFRFEAAQSFVEIDFTDEIDGDFAATVRFEVDGFAGTATCWITGEDVKRVREQIRAMPGIPVATLRSVSESEFSLEIKPSSGRGYFAITTQIADLLRGHSLSGTIEVETAQIDRFRDYLSKVEKQSK